MGARSWSTGFVHVAVNPFALLHASPPWTATSTRGGGVLSTRTVTGRELDALPPGSEAVTASAWVPSAMRPVSTLICPPPLGQGVKASYVSFEGTATAQ